MARYAGGDPDAFRELYDRWADRVYGFCLRYLQDEARAEDASQDTFRRLIEARDRYEEQGRFESWLFTLARRACVDQRRDAPDRERPLSGEGAGEGGSRDEAAGRDAPGPRSTPEERVHRRGRLRELLSELTPGQREALLLAKYEGFSYAEIAEMTDSTEAAAKQRVYRALRRLRGEGG